MRKLLIALTLLTQIAVAQSPGDYAVFVKGSGIADVKSYLSKTNNGLYATGPGGVTIIIPQSTFLTQATADGLYDPLGAAATAEANANAYTDAIVLTKADRYEIGPQWLASGNSSVPSQYFAFDNTTPALATTLTLSTADALGLNRTAMLGTLDTGLVFITQGTTAMMYSYTGGTAVGGGYRYSVDFKYATGLFLVASPALFQFDEVGTGGGSGTVAWGDITGTLDDQTDLRDTLASILGQANQYTDDALAGYTPPTSGLPAVLAVDATTGGTNIKVSSGDRIDWISGFFEGRESTDALSANRTWTRPNKSGTYAMTSDIPSPQGLSSVLGVSSSTGSSNIGFAAGTYAAMMADAGGGGTLLRGPTSTSGTFTARLQAASGTLAYLTDIVIPAWKDVLSVNAVTAGTSPVIGNGDRLDLQGTGVGQIHLVTDLTGSTSYTSTLPNVNGTLLSTGSSAGSFPTLNQSTTGSAATLTTTRSFSQTGDGSWTVNFNGSANATAAMTLATVNSNVGSFGSSTSIPSFTVNAKGLVTAASGNVVIAPAGTLTGTTLNSSVVTSSLTSVGTLASGNATAIVDAATTSAQGKVELATDGENAANVAVQGNDTRINRELIASVGSGQTTASTSFVDITSVFVSLAASTTYDVTLIVEAECSSTSGGIGIGINGSAAATRVSGRWEGVQSAGNLTRPDLVGYDAGAAAPTVPTAGAVYYFRLDGVVTNAGSTSTLSGRIIRGGSAGTITIRSAVIKAVKR